MAMTFKVNLQTVNYLSTKNPYSSNDPQGTNFKKTRTTWYPDLLNTNFVHHDGDTFTASGAFALYLKNNFTSGPYAFLTYVSGTAV